MKNYEELKYMAVPWMDFYYLVASESQQHEEEIILSEEEYNYLLEMNQENGWMVRGYVKEDGSLGVKSVVELNPTKYHIWSTKEGDWVIDEELRIKILTESYINKIAEDISWATEEIENIQELVDYDEATETDITNLDLVKRFRVSLNKIKRSSDYPNLEIPLPDRPY